MEDSPEAMEENSPGHGHGSGHRRREGGKTRKKTGQKADFSRGFRRSLRMEERPALRIGNSIAERMVIEPLKAI